MENQISALKSQIDQAYKKLSRTSYHVHAIIIHEGTAQSGHYYVFIYDNFNKKWKKFNDIRVTEVSEEEVFKEGNGGENSNKNAYWVVYINNDIKKQLEQNDVFRYKSMAGADQEHLYQKRL